MTHIVTHTVTCMVSKSAKILRGKMQSRVLYTREYSTIWWLGHKFVAHGNRTLYIVTGNTLHGLFVS